MRVIGECRPVYSTLAGATEIISYRLLHIESESCYHLLVQIQIQIQQLFLLRPLAYSLTDGALQKSADTCFTAVGGAFETVSATGCLLHN